MNTLTYTLLLVVIATLSYTVQGQSYHFSNGWNPGKRSSSQEVCHFRSEVKTLVFKLIEVNTDLVKSIGVNSDFF